MDIRIIASTEIDTELAVKEAIAHTESIAPSLVIVAFNSDLDAEMISTSLNSAFDCPIIGSTSCKGALCINEQLSIGNATLALMLIIDPTGNYGVGHKEIISSASDAAMDALDIALYASGRSYESPSLIWCMLPPGEEESILEGFANVVGPHVPIFGGSSADNEINGKWKQITDVSASSNQVSVAVLYPSKALGMSFSSGYEPTDITVTVSDAEQRNIKTLDGINAAEKYNELTAGSIQDYLRGGNVLALTTLSPLGRRIKSISGVEDYLLSHPNAITENGEISLFSEVKSGEALYLMQGRKSNLLKRANRVISNAIELLPEGSNPRGILLIYCAGCMLTIEDELEKMLTDVKNDHENLPIFGLFTFGEQGCFRDGQNRHGNLMISAVAFG